MTDLNEVIQKITDTIDDAAKHYGEHWDSALVGGEPNYHAITNEQAVVVRAEDDSLHSSWLCDYLEAVDPASVRLLLERIEILNAICDLFHIGEQARTRSAIMTNIENTIRFAEQLRAIEQAFFMVPGEPDEDYPDEIPADECLVNSCGSTTEQYVEQFREALAVITKPAPVVVDHAAVAPALLEELARSTPGEIIAVPRVSEENITRHVRDLTMMVKLLVRTVRKYNPESQQAKDFMQYLQREGLISTSDILRASPGEALKDPK